MQTMYPAKVNSPVTELVEAIDDTQTTIEILNGDALTDAPGLAVIGAGDSAETIMFLEKNGNILSDVTRGFQGVAKSWAAGTKLIRGFTAYDHDAFIENIEDHETRINDTENDLAAHKADTTTAHGINTKVPKYEIVASNAILVVSKQLTSDDETVSGDGGSRVNAFKMVFDPRSGDLGKLMFQVTDRPSGSRAGVAPFNTNLRINVDRTVTPGSDNVQKLGTSSLRWSEVFAGTGTINTSDENEKEQIEDLSAAEQAVAVALKGLIKKYKFKSAVAMKGSEARIHVGVIAQDVQQAFTNAGLDAHDYGVFCEDTWWEREETRTPMIDNPDYDPEEPESEDNPKEVEGDPYTVTEIYHEAVDGGVQKTRLGVRYDELFAFIISAL